MTTVEPAPPRQKIEVATMPQAGSGKRRFYLPEVDGIRCLAVLLVWIHHNASGPGRFLQGLAATGWIGVNVFLVLSSFLITTLLMLEAEAKGSISLPRFYSRRILRIWPLLALALVLNYLLLPAINYFPGGFHNAAFIHDLRCHAIPNALLLGNWSVAVFGYTAYGFSAHLWTINLEEQFYLLWPILMLYLVRKTRRILVFCVGLLAVSFLARLYYAIVGFPHPALWVSTITRLDPLAWGGILALLYPRLKSWLAVRHRFYDGVIVIAIVLGCLAITTVILHTWDWGSQSVWWKLGAIDYLVAVFVCCVILNPVLSLIFRMPAIAWLGKISYGLYVYSYFCARSDQSQAVRTFSARLMGGHPYLAWWSLGMLINSLVLVGISAASYYFFERAFLKFKERFETILSRPA
jgi:peptidoglycan/LPS O-acetylase OafA/YrhL